MGVSRVESVREKEWGKLLFLMLLIFPSLKRERKAKSRIENRGLTIVPPSGVLYGNGSRVVGRC